MPITDNLIEITLTVTLNNEVERVPLFNYTQNENGLSVPSTGSFVVNQPTTIRYYLIDKTEQGLEFTGAAFTNPFNNVVDRVEIGQDDRGSYIDLIDSDAIAGKTGFRFLLSNKRNNLSVMSPDPEIINRGKD